MKFKLERPKNNWKDTYTIGYLYIDHEDDVQLGWESYCDTLEDKVRDYNMDGKLDESKVPGETAIPFGTYKIHIQHSPHFGKDMPYLQNVHGFEGIMIHPGNTAIDTHGCILVGVNTVKGTVTNSRYTFDVLYKMMMDSKQTEWTIEIV